MHKQLLIVVNDLFRGGAQQIVYEIASRAPEHWSVSVAYFNEPKGQDTLLPQFESAGIHTQHLSGKNVFAKLNALTKYLRREKVQLVQTFLPYAGIIGRLAGAMTGVPVVSAQCNLPSAYPLKVRILDALTLGLTKAWVGNTSGIEVAYGGSEAAFSPEAWKNGRRHFTMYAGVDVPAIEDTVHRTDRAAVRASLGIPTDAPVVMMTARFISWKGHTSLIAALAQLPTTVHLILIGFGPLQETVRAQAASLGSAERVHFLGARNDVHAFLAAADVYVQTHTKEGGWSGPNLSQFEACAAGVPSVSTAVPRIESLIEDEVTGKLATCDDPVSIAAAIQFLIDHPEEATTYAANARERVEKRFSSDAMAKAYYGLYDSVLA